MNLHLLQSFKQQSSEFFDSSQNVKKGKAPNSFLLNLFRQKSTDEQCSNIQNPLDQYIQGGEQIFLNSTTSQNLSQFFQLYQQPSKLELDSKGPSLEQFIIKQQATPLKKAIRKKKSQQIDPAIRDYKKNICRNILRHAIKSLNSDISQEHLNVIFQNNQEKVGDFLNFYNSNLEFISGFRVLKHHLLMSQNDKEEIKQRKRAFKEYLTWFLKNRATLYIIHSEANNVREYIKYKNEVLLFYVQRPESWYSNKPLWKMEKKLSIQKNKKKVQNQQHDIKLEEK